MQLNATRRGNLDIVGTPRCGLLECQSEQSLDPVSITEGVTIANFGSPAANQIDMIFLQVCHFWIPVTNKLRILINFIGFYSMEDD